VAQGEFKNMFEALRIAAHHRHYRLRNPQQNSDKNKTCNNCRKQLGRRSILAVMHQSRHQIQGKANLHSQDDALANSEQSKIVLVLLKKLFRFVVALSTHVKYLSYYII
jgi:hypothetical protein